MTPGHQALNFLELLVKDGLFEVVLSLKDQTKEISFNWVPNSCQIYRNQNRHLKPDSAFAYNSRKGTY